MLVFWFQCGPGSSRRKASKGEILGVMISFLGIVMSEAGEMIQPDVGGDESRVSGAKVLLGDGLCLLSAAFIAVDIVISGKSRQVVPLFTYSFLTGALTLLIVTVLSLAIERTSFFSISITEGHFGWVRSEGGLIWLNILFGFLEGMIGVVVSGSGKHIQRG